MKSLVLVFMLAAGAQQAAPPAAVQVAPVPPGAKAVPQSTPTPADDLPSTIPQEYQLGPGDLMTVKVSGVKDFEQSARVSNSGRIRVPYVGVMFVAGLTTFEVEKEVARLIKEHELVNEPIVRVSIDEYHAQPIYAIGEFKSPGQFVTKGDMHLLDLVSKAGGLLGGANETGYLYRRNRPRPVIQSRMIGEGDPPSVPFAAPSSTAPSAGPSAGEPSASPIVAGPSASDPMVVKNEQVTVINFKELREGVRPEANVVLKGGDILYVPAARPDNLYLIGDVKNPGAYTMPRRGQYTAAQALISAGGVLPTAKMGNGFIMRHDETGLAETIPVNFSEIIAGKQADVPLKPNDIIFIPNSYAKTVGLALFNYIPELVRQFIIF
jgi:polysaccharide export outer membrane protein